MKKRIVLDVAIFIITLNAWWFLALPIAIAAAWIFPVYLEIILFGLMYDALFGMTTDLGIKGLYGSIFAIAFFIIINLLKKIVRK